MPLVSVEPADGTTGVTPDAHVVVGTNDGRLASVDVVNDAGRRLDGAMWPGGKAWLSNERLPFDSHYRVEVHVAGLAHHHTAMETFSFSTVRPAGFLRPTISPGDGSTVGVGEPIVIHFASPVTDRAAVVRALDVTMSDPVPGAWHWFGGSEIHYRPQEYWPPGERISVRARLTNLDAGNGVWGDADKTVDFTVGDAHVSLVDVNAHTMTVTSNGAVVKTVPISAGRDQYPTMGGVHVVLEKAYDVLMDSSTVGIPRDSPDGYYEHVFWDVAISTGGEYVHAAPWSAGAQGNSNVSHGCVNLSNDDAQWFYGFSRAGDIVNVVGSPRPPDGDPAVADWNIPWDQWVSGA
jgi:lipoprotein-anchoring transpeptidase ErfK/SrfK